MKLSIIKWTDAYCETHREAIIGPRGKAQQTIRERPDYVNIISIEVITIDNVKIIN